MPSLMTSAMAQLTVEAWQKSQDILNNSVKLTVHSLNEIIRFAVVFEVVENMVQHMMLDAMHVEQWC